MKRITKRAAWLLLFTMILGSVPVAFAQDRPARPSRPTPPAGDPPDEQQPTRTFNPKSRGMFSEVDPIYAVLGGMFVSAIGGAIFFWLRDQKSKKAPSEPVTVDPIVNGEIGGYRLLNLMMTGQTSQVWEVAEVKSGRHFALKILLIEQAKNPETRKLLFYEAEVCKQLEHPNIIKVVAVCKSPKAAYFVMEFFPGGNLKFRIMHKENDFIKEHLHGILKQISTALAFMHAKGWVHRDIKPDNILVNAVGEARLIDFAIGYKIPSGMAKTMHRKGKTAGTRSYMSPEQIRDEVLDGRADVYSLGCTIYELVTGRPPFRANTPSDLLKKHLTEKPDPPNIHNKDLTDDFSNLIYKMIAKKKEDRPNNFHEILVMLKKMRLFKSQTVQNLTAAAKIGNVVNAAKKEPAKEAEATNDVVKAPADQKKPAAPAKGKTTPKKSV